MHGDVLQRCGRFNRFLVISFSQVTRWASPCCTSDRSRRGRAQIWFPAPGPPQCGTSGRQRRCAVWFSAAGALWEPRPGRGPRRSPGPSCGGSSGREPPSWPRCGPSPGRSGWDSSSARSWRKIFSAASQEPPGNTLRDPKKKKKSQIIKFVYNNEPVSVCIFWI